MSFDDVTVARDMFTKRMATGIVFQRLKISSSISMFDKHIFSSPEHEVLMVSYCDRAVSVVSRASSVVNFLPCVRSRGHSFGRILMKVGEDVCLDEISDEFENGSCGVKN